MSVLPIARLAVLVPAAALFLLPGWMAGRALRSPLGMAGAFLGSAALVFNLVLLLDVLRIPLRFVTVGCAYAAATGLVAIWALRRWPPSEPRTRCLPRGHEWLWIVPAGLALASIAARGVVEPLSGDDNAFRWDYLARLILTRHSLAAYPPVTMADFDLYSWCDGIPPLVPILNFLLYGACGSGAPGLITVRAVAEFFLLASLVWRFARDLWGPPAGWAAVAVLCSSALFIWGIAIEQETGMTALALVAMMYALHGAGSDGQDPGPRLFWAGVAAAVGAISREYGLYFVLLGAALAWRRLGLRSMARFLVPALAVAAPWYLRNWVKTGDPVFPALGRIFPTNAVHVEIMGDIRQFWGFGAAPFLLRDVPLELAATCGAVLLLGAAGLLRSRPRAVAILCAVLLVGSLWAWSMPLTAGGWSYSMRVLLPALALGSVLAGWVGTAGRRSAIAVAILLAVLSVDAARRAWLLPDFPFATPWTLSFGEWRALHGEGERQSRGNVWSVLSGAAGSRYIVVDSPMPFVAVMGAGGHPTPITSPRFAPALDPSLSVGRAVDRLRALGVRFVTFSVRNPVVNRLVRRHATLRDLADHYAPAATINGLLIFDLDYLVRRPSANGT